MRITILNGMTDDNQCLINIQETISAQLLADKAESQTFFLGETDIAPCNGCFGCWIKTPGVCTINDAGREIAKTVIQSDLLIFLTPVTFGGYSSQLKKALDRIIGLVSPFFLTVNNETHHRPRYEKYPRMLFIGSLSSSDEESRKIFLSLAKRNAINFHTPAYAGEVIIGIPDKEEIRRKVISLLEKVGVNQ